MEVRLRDSMEDERAIRFGFCYQNARGMQDPGYGTCFPDGVYLFNEGVGKIRARAA